MNLRRLTYFLAVVDHGGFTAAARAVFVSQPALSLAIKELEHELGTELFQRLGRTVRLTAAGEVLVGPARQALRDVETGKAAVQAVVGLRGGTLSLASLPTLAAHPLADLIGRFRRMHPDVVVDLSAPEDTAELVALLRTGQSELGICEHVALPDDLVTYQLEVQRLLVIRPPGSPRPAGPLHLRDLADTPMVATPLGTSSRRLLEEGFATAGVTPMVAVVTAQREAILPLVLGGAGAALVPESMAIVAEHLGAVIAEPRPAVRRQIVVACRPGPQAPAAQGFLALLDGGAPGR